MSTPSKNNPELARALFKHDLKRIPPNYVERYGWNLTPDFDSLRLCVDMWSVDDQYVQLDDFHIVMDLSYYRNWPPGVTFVNPETSTFESNSDAKWLPQIKSRPTGTDIDYHQSYKLNSGETKQMVCNSMCLEYYQSNHNPTQEEKWDPDRHTLFATLHLLQTMLTRPYYGGRST